MKKPLKMIIILLFNWGIANSVIANTHEGSCAVLGVREPGTNIYDGPTFCDETTLSYITVRGPLQLKKTTIKGDTNVSGPIKAKQAILQSISIEDNLTSNSIYLLSDSIVNGTIQFKGREGIIYLENGSLIKGKIINAKVIPQPKNSDAMGNNDD